MKLLVPAYMLKYMTEDEIREKANIELLHLPEYKGQKHNDQYKVIEV